MIMKRLLPFVFFVVLPVCAQVNNSAIIYADQYLPPTYSYQSIVDNVCPANGCTIYATSPNAPRDLGVLDPHDKVVTIYLGPFIYTVNTITLRRGMRVIGMGAAPLNATTGTSGTILQSTNTANDGLFKLPQTDNTPVTDVYLYGLRLQATAGNTGQWGIILDCSNLTNSGLWHSTFEDLQFSGFHGSAMLFYGPHTGVPSANQFISMRNIWAIRPDTTSLPDLWIEGANGQIDCIECHLNGPPRGSAGDSGFGNVFIGNLNGGTQTPYSIHFFNLSSEGANIGVHIQGAEHLSFIGSHHEDLFGAYLITDQVNNPTRDVWIANALFAANVGKNGGAGYIVNATNAGGVTLDSPVFKGTPDAYFTGSAAGFINFINGFNDVGGAMTWSTPSGLAISQDLNTFGGANISGALTAGSGTIFGDLNVNGTLFKSAGFFRIDDPLDPDNKYLSHSFVESPDMKNIYDGVVWLNKKGEAEVQLPAWFQALNQDFRYQLTCIGASAPVYIAREVRNNRFKIAGGRPGLKVSWQVTGIRHDDYANTHQVPVEEEKPAKERGHRMPAPDLAPGSRP